MLLDSEDDKPERFFFADWKVAFVVEGAEAFLLRKLVIKQHLHCE